MKTKQQIINWEVSQRQKYKKGLLSPSQIKKLESFTDWYWDFKQEAIEQAQEIFEKAKKIGRLPKKGEKYYHWINDKKKAKAGKGSNFWYPELEEIAKQYGFPHAFDIIDRKQEVIKKAHEVFKKAKEIGSLPNKRSKNKEEARYGRWVSTNKKSKRGKGTGVWYPELDVIAEQYGFPHAFDVVDYKQKDIKKAHEIFKKAQEIGRLPNKKEKNYEWIITKKQAKLGKGVWYPELDEIAKQYGFPNAFDIIGKKQQAINKAHKIFQKSTKIGRLPQRGEKYYNWIHAEKQAKAGRGGNFWYPELDEIAKQYGFPNAFALKDRKQEAIEQAHEMFKEVKKIGRLPNKKGDKYYNCISNQKRAKSGKGSGVWYSELDEIAKKYGFPNAYNPKQNKQKSVNKAHEIFKEAKKIGRLPKEKEKNYNWIHHKKRAKSGNVYGNVWYPEFDKIAEQYGFPNVFLDNKTMTIDKTHEVFKKAKKIGKLPKSSGKSTSKDGRWIQRKRQAKIGKGSSIWYPELEEIAKQYGFPHAFDIIDIKQEVIEHAHEMFKEAKKIGRLPKEKEKDYNWIQARKKAKMGHIWYSELDELATNYGFPHVFDFIDRKQEAIDKAHEVFQIAKEMGRFPKQKEKNGSWIGDKKKAKAGKSGVWYPELDRIAEQYGFTNIFNLN